MVLRHINLYIYFSRAVNFSMPISQKEMGFVNQSRDEVDNVDCFFLCQFNT